MFSRRWVLFFLTVVLLAWGAYLLGQWQFHRLADRKASNAVISHNLVRPPTDVADVLAPDRPVSDTHDWLHVTTRGRYDEQHSVVIRYQTRDGAAGVDVVTPLVTGSGAAVLVDRGWLATQNVGRERPRIPAAPAGLVTVTGWLRQDATGDSAVVTDASARSISSEEIARTLPYPVYGGFVDLQRETPRAARPLVPTEVPDLSNGPHFFYGLQWWFFGLLAIFGFGYLAFDERRANRRGDTSIVQRRAERAAAHAQSARTIPPSTGSITPDTNDADGESRNAAARPNSSGRP